MKKAINQWCFPNDWSWERVFNLCKKAGFKGIEICVDHIPFFEAVKNGQTNSFIADIARSVGSSLIKSKSLRFDNSKEEFNTIAIMAHENGLSITSLLTLSLFHYTLIDRDEKMWRSGIDLVKKLIDFAVIMGAPNLLLVSGVMTPEISYDFAYKRLADAFWILKEEAEKNKVGLGLENVWGKLLYSPLEMRDFIDRFESPYVGVHFDVGNVLQYGYPEQWIRLLGKKRLLNIHLKDYSDTINNARAFTHMFQGSVPWDRVMGALRDVGYDGYLIAEVPPYPFCPEEGIWDISRKMDILISQNY